MKKIYLSVATGFLAMAVNAQQPQLNQVIILNEGPFGGPVTIGSYDPVSKNYSVFDTIAARFASDVLIENGIIYVAADTLLIKYDADTKQQLDMQTVPGIRELATWNNQLLATRGDYVFVPTYFQVYDKNTLDLIYEIDTISGDAAEVKVVGDTAYVAVNDFGSMGKLAVIDLNNQVLDREIDLGPDGLNPENVEIGKNGKIYTVNSLDWSDISVTKYDVNSSTFQSIKLGASSGCGASALSHMGQIYFQQGDNFNGTTEILERNLGVYDAQTSLGFWDTLMVNKQIYGMGIDSVNGRIYLSATDFFSFGKIFLFDFYGNATDSFDVGITPGSIAMDVRTAVGENEFSGNAPAFSVYPNPNNGKFNVWTEAEVSVDDKLIVRNLLGQIIYQAGFSGKSVSIDLEKESPGVYSVEMKTANGSVTKKLIKQ